MPNSAMRNTFERIIINQFTPLHCAQARELLGWSLEQLSDKSKVSVPAIQRRATDCRVYPRRAERP